MPPTGQITDSGVYKIHICPVIGTMEVGISQDQTITVSPTSIMLKTPMKRPFPFGNTDS
jgi:hypothetical protein